MLVVRLKKISLKKNVSYHIVISSKEIAPKSKKFLEKVGYSKPLVDKWANKYVFLDSTRLLFWIKRGAKINSAVFSVIKPLSTQLLQ